MSTAKRISAVLGAGVNLDFQLQNKPSTYYITEKVVNASYPVINYPDINNKENSSLVKDIYNAICQRYTSGELDPNTSYGIIHFEIIFHVLEELYSYDKYWRENRYKSPSDIPPFAYITLSNIKYKSDHIWQVMRHFIQIIMNIVKEYDKEYNNNKNGIESWYKEFWSLCPFKWDLFTFNYDTALENSLSAYEDGFEAIEGYQFKQMNPMTLLDSNEHTINHLHGCILYGEDRYKLEHKNRRTIYDYDSKDWFCWNNYEMAEQNRFNTSGQQNQAGESIFRSPIITGLHKTDKIVNLPFDIYRYNFNRKLISNNAILIAGYSFGDLYVNYELERMQLYHGGKWRVVLIDYWGKDTYPSKTDETRVLYSHIAKLPYKNRLLYDFLCKVMEVGELDRHTLSRKWNFATPNLSDNGRLMLFISGTKNALRYRNDIYNFLQS